MSSVLIGLSLLFFIGHALNWFFEKTKIPDLLVLIIFGYMIGPVFGLVDITDFGKVGAALSTIALVVILYEGGLHLNARDLLTSSLPALGITLIGFYSHCYLWNPNSSIPWFSAPRNFHPLRCRYWQYLLSHRYTHGQKTFH